MLQATHQEPLGVGNLIQSQSVAGIENYGYSGGWEGSLVDRKLRYGLNATGAYTRLQQGGLSIYPLVAPQVFANAHVGDSLGRSLPPPTPAAYRRGPPAPRPTPPPARTA